MKEAVINAKINEQDRVITIDASPSWGKLQELLRALSTTNAQGKPDIPTLLNKILQLTVINGFDEMKDPVKFALISGEEITYILGEILSIIPLQKYSKNLKVEELGLLNAVQ